MSPNKAQPLTNEYALLGLLQSAPLHGYMLDKALNAPDGIGQTWRVKQARLYALLAKLESLGYLSETVEQQDLRPARKIYHLTASGRTAFNDWLSRPVLTPRQTRQELQLKFYFTLTSNPEYHHRLIDSQIEVCRKWLAMQQLEDGQHSAYTALVRSYRQGQLEAMIKWLQKTRLIKLEAS